MRAILLGPVVVPYREQKSLFRSLKIQPSDLLVGVDGGTQLWKKWGYRVGFAVGDWDSLKKSKAKSKAILSDIPHITLPRAKDRSDLFFAALAAIEAGANELVCLGVTGGRPDHHLAMIYDLSSFSTGCYGKLRSVQAMGPEGNYHFLSEAIPSWKGTTSLKNIVSIFAINGKAEGITLSGFQYSLKNAVLNPSSLGLSNRTLRRDCKVSLRKGRLLIMTLRNGDE